MMMEVFEPTEGRQWWKGSQHVIVVASEPEAKELNDDIIDNDGGGGIEASVPQGEGADGTLFTHQTSRP